MQVNIYMIPVVSSTIIASTAPLKHRHLLIAEVLAKVSDDIFGGVVYASEHLYHSCSIQHHDS